MEFFYLMPLTAWYTTANLTTQASGLSAWELLNCVNTDGLSCHTTLQDVEPTSSNPTVDTVEEASFLPLTLLPIPELVTCFPQPTLP